MKYIAIIDEEMLSNFRIDEPPYYMPEDDKILVVKDELGCTRGIQLKPLSNYEDCISREKAKQFLYERLDWLNDDELYDIFSRIIDDMYNELPTIIEVDSFRITRK